MFYIQRITEQLLASVSCNAVVILHADSEAALSVDTWFQRDQHSFLKRRDALRNEPWCEEFFLPDGMTGMMRARITIGGKDALHPGIKHAGRDTGAQELVHLFQCIQHSGVRRAHLVGWLSYEKGPRGIGIAMVKARLKIDDQCVT